MRYMEPEDNGEDYLVCQCDKCGRYVDRLYYGELGEELCEDCLCEQYKMADTDICDRCEEVDALCYEVDGECLCKDCILEMSEEVGNKKYWNGELYR